RPALVNSSSFLYSTYSTFFYVYGAMVQRLARGPFKAKMRVRFPLALPKLQNFNKNAKLDWALLFLEAYPLPDRTESGAANHVTHLSRRSGLALRVVGA